MTAVDLDMTASTSSAKVLPTSTDNPEVDESKKLTDAIRDILTGAGAQANESTVNGTTDTEIFVRSLHQHFPHLAGPSGASLTSAMFNASTQRAKAPQTNNQSLLNAYTSLTDAATSAQPTVATALPPMPTGTPLEIMRTLCDRVFMTTQGAFEGNVTLNEQIWNYEQRAQEVSECFLKAF